MRTFSMSRSGLQSRQSCTRVSGMETRLTKLSSFGLIDKLRQCTLIVSIFNKFYTNVMQLVKRIDGFDTIKFLMEVLGQ